MQPYPHRYHVAASAQAEGDVVVSGKDLPALQTAPPLEFGGPGDQWSPETLLIAAVADCYILSFRAIVGFAKLSWISLTCEVEGVLDKVDRVTRFTRFEIKALLKVPTGTSEDKAKRVLEQAEKICLVTNSLNGQTHLSVRIEIAPDSVA